MSSTLHTIEHRKRIDRLFLRFTAFYGPLWRSQLKNDEFLAFMKNEWIEGLKDIEDKYLDEAIDYCRRYREFPPSLPQLHGLCRDAKRRAVFHKAEAYKKANPGVVKQYLTKMKLLLK